MKLSELGYVYNHQIPFDVRTFYNVFVHSCWLFLISCCMVLNVLGMLMRKRLLKYPFLVFCMFRIGGGNLEECARNKHLSAFLGHILAL
jgi:hypothetical protein